LPIDLRPDKSALWRIAIVLAMTIPPGSTNPAAVAQSPSPLRMVPDSAFRPLFNGRDLSGWHGRDHVDPRSIWTLDDGGRARAREKSLPDFQKRWRVEDGALVNDGEGPYATTDQEFGDIELRLEYRTVPKADSGIYLRGNPQVQIWDTTEAGGKWDRGAQFGSGGLFNNAPGTPGRDPLVKADKPFGQWNRVRIIQVGERTWVWLNGERVVDGARMENYWDRALPLWPRGPIQLQTHGGEIRWRHILVRDIPPAEATAILSARDRAGYERIFNGRDWTGWKGPTGQYSIVDGAIVCNPDQGGTIYTAHEYADFSARLEFKVPPGGNNGLAIRYPGEGDTAYVGMCELQVLDDDSPKYATLDPRQYHGSIYGMVAAHRGYLRPAGEWNFQEVTVTGSTIVVELNGTRIVDADVAKVTEFMDGREHPGKDRRSGHFGFAGHNDPVAYRNVFVKVLQ
jgi:3-keto-disaccharide hydrolase